MNLTCIICGSRTPITLHRGHQDVTVEHEAGCAFLTAVERGQGGAWVKEHGPAVVLVRSDLVGRN